MKEEKKQSHLLKKGIVIILIILILTFFYARIWIHKTIRINEYSVIGENLPSNWNGFKIVQFSDIHFGKTTNESEFDKMIQEINLTNPDIIIFTGDLFDNSINLTDKSIDYLKEAFKNINARLMKLAIRGDNDYKDIELYNEILNNAGFQILENNNTLIFDKGLIPIQIAGISSVEHQEFDLKKSFETKETTISYKILIAHEPDILDQIENENIDLILSGHSLGGHINLPFLGGIIKQNHTNNYQKGQYQKENTIMYVSSGIGTEKVNFRFLNPPSINLYRFYNYK